MYVLPNAVPVKKSVKCLKCGKIHDIDSETFLVVYGNITIGLGGGLVGNNFDESGKLQNASVYCSSGTCFVNALGIKNETSRQSGVAKKTLTDLNAW